MSGRFSVRTLIPVLAPVASTSITLIAVFGCSGGQSGQGQASPGKSTPNGTAEATAASTNRTSGLSKEHAERLAKSVLLTVEDFPAGWSSANGTDDEAPSELNKRCGTDKSSPGRLAKAEMDFDSGHTVSISQTVLVFDSRESALGSLDPTFERGECLARYVNDGLMDTPEAAYSKASVSTLASPKLGEHSMAVRFKMRVKAKGQSGFGSEADVFLDTMYFVNDRFAVSVQATDVLTPFDTSKLTEMATKAADRVASAIGQANGTGELTTPAGGGSTESPTAERH